MKQELFNSWYLIVYVVGALAAGIFALVQIIINRRLMALQSYVTVSIVPITNPGPTYSLQIRNVGKVNLYLMKSEVGAHVQNFDRGRLLSIGGDPFFVIPAPLVNLGQEMEIKLYLQDELGRKYLTTGGLAIDPHVQQGGVPARAGDESTGVPMVSSAVVLSPARAWAYKTERFNWHL